VQQHRRARFFFDSRFAAEPECELEVNEQGETRNFTYTNNSLTKGSKGLVAGRHFEDAN
jgi:hypothetical protein